MANTCSICLENLSDDYKLVCNHVFHKECITYWLTKSNTCPLCRTVITWEEKYVTDGILSMERFTFLKNICILTATGLELIFPTELEGYSENITSILSSNIGTNIINGLYNNPDAMQTLDACFTNLQQFLN